VIIVFSNKRDFFYLSKTSSLLELSAQFLFTFYTILDLVPFHLLPWPRNCELTYIIVYCMLTYTILYSMLIYSYNPGVDSLRLGPTQVCSIWSVWVIPDLYREMRDHTRSECSLLSHLNGAFWLAGLNFSVSGTSKAP